MDKTNVTKRVTATILSMSLLTVMAGAAIAPALGIIKAHFSEADALLEQLAVRLEGEVEAISAKLPEHVHECAVVLRGRHLDLSHPHFLRPAALHHHHRHPLGEDALPAGKAGPVTIRNGSRITNMCYSIPLLYRRRYFVKLS